MKSQVALSAHAEGYKLDAQLEACQQDVLAPEETSLMVVSFLQVYLKEAKGYRSSSAFINYR